MPCLWKNAARRSRQRPTGIAHSSNSPALFRSSIADDEREWDSPSLRTRKCDTANFRGAGIWPAAQIFRSWQGAAARLLEAGVMGAALRPRADDLSIRWLRARNRFR